LSTDIKKLSKVLFGVIFILLLIHTVLTLYSKVLNPDLFEFLNAKFNVENEANIPTWVSSNLLLLISITAFILARLHTEKAINRIISDRLFWATASAVFAYLSLDEFTQLHESIDLATNYQVKWVVFYAPFAIGFILLSVYYIGFIQQNKHLQNYFLGGLILIAIGGIGLEVLDYYVQLPYAIRNIVRTSEEALELFGTTLILTGSLQELSTLLEQKRLWKFE